MDSLVVFFLDANKTFSHGECLTVSWKLENEQKYHILKLWTNEINL